MKNCMRDIKSQKTCAWKSTLKSLFAVCTLPMAAIVLANSSLDQASQAASGYLSQSLDRQTSSENAPSPENSNQLKGVSSPRVDNGGSFFLKDISFSGSKVIPLEELERLSSAYLDKIVSLADIEKLSDAIRQYALSKGDVIQVFAPPQEVKGGVLRLQIAQANFGGVSFSYPESATPFQEDAASRERIESRAAEYIYNGNAPGFPLDLKALDRSLIILNDQSSKSYIGTLKPGMSPGQTDLAIEVTPQNNTFGSVGVNNYGPQSTGTIQYSGQVLAKDILGGNEIFSLYGIAASGTTFIKGSYSMPIAPNGMRISLDANSLEYKTIGVYAGSSGGSTAASVQISYPLLASKAGITNANINLSSRSFENNTLNTVVSQYSIRSIGADIGGYKYNNFIYSSLDSYSIGVLAGSIYNNNSPLQYQSNYVPSTNTYISYVPSNYTKLNAFYSKMLFLSGQSTLKISTSGQMASASLNSAEAIYVSGPSSVRAYRPATAYGTQGAIVSVDFDHDIFVGLKAGAFFDYATVMQYKGGVTSAMINSSTPPNTYQIFGGGVKFSYSHNKNGLLTGYIATPLDRTNIPSLQSTGGKPAYIIGLEARYTGAM